MKVQDLIETLQTFDPEFDIFVAPLISLPSMNDGERRTIDLFKRYPAAKLAKIKEFVGEGNEVVVIGFDENRPHRTDLSREIPDDSNDLVN